MSLEEICKVSSIPDFDEKYPDEESIILALMEAGILRNEVNCANCGNLMVLRKKRGTLEWRCRVNKKVDCSSQSVKKDSFFSKTQLPFKSAMKLIIMWRGNFCNAQIEKELKISKNTVVAWRNFLSEKFGHQKMPKVKKSKYDAYFEKIDDTGRCRLCRSCMPWTKTGGTNCLRLHLASKHPLEMRQFMEEQALLNPKRESPQNPNIFNALTTMMVKTECAPEDWKVQNSISSSPQYQISDEDRMVMETVCGDRWPIQNVDGEWFGKMLRQLKPRFDLKPSRHYIDYVLPALKQDFETKIRIDLKFAPKISLVFDYGTTGIGGPDCVSVMAHWMNTETMASQKALLDFRLLRNPEEIGADFLNSIISNFEISGNSQIVGIINENGGVSDGIPILPNFEGILDKIARILYSNHYQLLEKQKSMALEFRHLLNLHGSRFSTIEFPPESELSSESLQRPGFLSWSDHCGLLYLLLDMRIPDALAAFYRQQGSSKLPEMTPEEKTLSEFIYSILKEIKSARNSIRHREYSTASVVIPTLRVLLHKLEGMVQNELATTSSIKHQVITDLKNASTLCQNNMTLKTATFLDARFRNRYFFESHKHYMLSTFREHAESVMPSESSGFDEPLDVKPADMSSFDLFLQEQGSTGAVKSEAGNLEKEIDEYLREEPNSQSDPIDFWVYNQEKFPILKSLASQYLAIPASANSGTRKICDDGRKIFADFEQENIMENFAFCCTNLDYYGSF